MIIQHNILYVKLHKNFDIWSKLLSKTSLKKRKFFLFDANEENRNFLEKLNFKFFFHILSDQNKDVNFYSNFSTGDSYLKEQTSLYKENSKLLLKKFYYLEKDLNLKDIIERTLTLILSNKNI